MKYLIALALIFSATQSLAAGGFICKSMDNNIVVSGIDSSAGTAVTDVEINGKTLEKGKTFTADQIYKGMTQFNFRIMDEARNNILLEVETQKVTTQLYYVGGAWVGVYREANAVICQFTY